MLLTEILILWKMKSTLFFNVLTHEYNNLYNNSRHKYCEIFNLKVVHANVYLMWSCS